MSLEDLQNQMAGERKPREVPPGDPFSAYNNQGKQPVITGQPLADAPPAAPAVAPPPPKATYTAYPQAAPTQAAPPQAQAAPTVYPGSGGYPSAAPASRKVKKSPRVASSAAAPNKTKPLLISASVGLILMLVVAFSFIGPSCGGVSGFNDFQPYYLSDLRVTDEGDGNVGVFNGSTMPVLVKYIIVNGLSPETPVNEVIPPQDQRNYSTPFHGEMTFIRVQTNHPANGGVRAGPPDAKPEIHKDDSGKGSSFFGI